MKELSYTNKSSINEIRKRFDSDVERFSNVETGQQTIIDAPICLELITSAALYVNPRASSLLDIGCGAGNYTLKMLQKIPDMNCTLVDLSMPMLQRAKERVSAATTGNIEVLQENILEAVLPDNSYDIILAAAVLHHLRGDEEWEKVFTSIYKSLKPGGSFWVSDMVSHEPESLNELFKRRYADYLDSLGGEEFRLKVFDYIEVEDTPRSICYQIELMKKVGFRYTEVLHKNGCFAAFGAVK